MEKVVIVIVNWNTGDLLKRCLQSIQRLPQEEQVHIQAVIVVDNNSTDSSVQQAKESTRDVRFVELKENAGFARATNRGVREAGVMKTGDHVLLLNPDTEMQAGSLTAMLDVLKRNSRAGIVGPLLRNSDGSRQESVRRFPNLLVFVLLFLKLQRLVPKLPAWKTYMMHDFSYDREEEVDQVMGAAFLIRHAALKDVGLLDEKFWVWFEEVDFCKRAKAAGWKTIFNPDGQVIHHGGASFGQLIGLQRTIPFLRSSIWYARKHEDWIAPVVLLLLYPLAALLALPAGIVHMIQRMKT